MKKSRISNFIMLYMLFLVFVFAISFGDLDTVEAAEFQGEVDEDTIVEIMNAKPSETNVGGYSIDAITQAGMGKNFDHPLYSLNIVVLSCSTEYDQELNGSAGEIVLQYTFMPKVDGFYKFRYDDLLAEGIWTDALGNTIPFVKDYVECKAGSIYTCNRDIVHGTDTVGCHTANMIVSIMNAKVGNSGVSLSYQYHFFDYNLLPSAKPLNTADNVITDSNSFTVSGIGGDGYKVLLYKEKSDDEWKSEAVDGSLTKKITGLRPDTEYQVKIQATLTVKDRLRNEINLISPDSNIITFKTENSTKPVIKSVKITKVKYKKKKTSFKIEAVLKKNIKGIKGIVINVAGKNYVLKGDKKKYSVNVSMNGNKVGKNIKVKVRTYNNAEMTGYGPYSKNKTVKIKK